MEFPDISRHTVGKFCDVAVELCRVRPVPKAFRRHGFRIYGYP